MAADDFSSVLVEVDKERNKGQISLRGVLRQSPRSCPLSNRERVKDAYLTPGLRSIGGRTARRNLLGRKRLREKWGTKLGTGEGSTVPFPCGADSVVWLGYPSQVASQQSLLLFHRAGRECPKIRVSSNLVMMARH